MAFLKEGSPFPPPNWEYWINKYQEFASWYSGDINELLKYYTDKTINPYSERAIFWARIEGEERETTVHMPAAGDISSTSADLLFSETPEFVFKKDSKGGERINDFIRENGFANILLEGAEMAAALTGVFLKIDIDTRISKLPLVSIITPLQAFPIFLRGRLWEILFYREVKVDKGGSIIYRLFENRSRGNNGIGVNIEFKLYKGTNDKVGREVDLNSIEETETLSLKNEYFEKIEGLGVVYIPNMRPNRLIPGSPLGLNDFNGCIPLLDSLDMSWTSLVRDIELGMGQIFVDEELMMREEKNIFGTEKTMLNQFSKFQKCFMKLNLSNYKMAGDNVKPIEVMQFEMRVEEHLMACEQFYKNIVSQCGYSPSTFGMDSSGRAESGTALRIRERKSFLTRNKKSRYWQPAIKQILTMMQQFDNSIGGNYYNLEEVGVELEDSIVTDSKEQSETIKNLDQARAISTYIKVKMQHPDWEETDIEAEVRRIQDEEGIEKSSDLIDLTEGKDEGEDEGEEEKKDKDSNIS